MSDVATIAMILASILPQLFGGGKSQTTIGESETDRKGFQWPGLPAEVTRMYTQLLGKNEQMQGFGMPPGMTSPTAGTSGDMMQDIIKMLEQSWPAIMAGYQQRPGARQPGDPISAGTLRRG